MGTKRTEWKPEESTVWYRYWMLLIEWWGLTPIPFNQLTLIAFETFMYTTPCFSWLYNECCQVV